MWFFKVKTTYYTFFSKSIIIINFLKNNNMQIIGFKLNNIFILLIAVKGLATNVLHKVVC